MDEYRSDTVEVTPILDYPLMVEELILGRTKPKEVHLRVTLKLVQRDS